MTDTHSQPSIVERLRRGAKFATDDLRLDLMDAADRIEELERQAERAHEAWLAAERRIEELESVIGWVDSWVSNPVGSYSVYALAGLFSATCDKIAAAVPQFSTPAVTE